MNAELTITTERIDDFRLLLAVMQRLGLPEILDRHLKVAWFARTVELGVERCHLAGPYFVAGGHRKLPMGGIAA